MTLMERQLPTSSREHSSPASSPQKRSPSRSSPGKAEDKKNKRTMEPERRQAEMHKLIGSIFGPPAATAPAPLASASPSLQPYATSLLPTASLFTPQHFRQEPFTPQPQTPLPQAQPFSSPLYSTSSDKFCSKLEPADLKDLHGTPEDQLLAPEYATVFRSLTCGALWACQTNCQELSQVTSLQQKLKQPTYRDLLMINSVIKRLSITFQRPFWIVLQTFETARKGCVCVGCIISQ